VLQLKIAELEGVDGRVCAQLWWNDNVGGVVVY